MITYSFPKSKTFNTIKQTFELSFFVGQNILSFEQFASNQKLVMRISEIDSSYDISSSIQFHINDTYKQDNQNLMSTTISKRIQNIYSLHTHKVTTQEEISSLIPMYVFYEEGGDEKGFWFLYKHALENKGKIDYSEKNNEIKALYVTFLYLVYQTKLYRLVNTETGDIALVDSSNIDRLDGNEMYSILSIDEFFFRGDLSQMHKNNLLRAKKDRTNKYYEIFEEFSERDEKVTKEYGDDVYLLRKDYPFHGKNVVVDMCNDWISRGDVSQITIESENHYWLVKPTIKKSKLENDDLVEETKRFGIKEVKYHEYKGISLPHTFYTPCYKILKNLDNTL